MIRTTNKTTLESLIRAVTAVECEDLPIFVAACKDVMLGSEVRIPDIIQYIESEWDIASPFPPWADEMNAPILVDLHATHLWGLRLSIWEAPEIEAIPEQIIHSHFGYIVTKALSQIAYSEMKYSDEGDRVRLEKQHLFGYPEVNIITPSTFHAIQPVPDNLGLTLSVRTRAVVDRTWEVDATTQKKKPRENTSAQLKAHVITKLGCF